ncbi:hypothetical protein B0H15DRAFT_806855 [Mycena belliarum]|uniref:Uncharacterized protein n=1 Tax=Mycena belliarum TaxID=1033014 RepID=A0AAD6TMJ2_9AGAR|nr:hypothetical protein B0H15DRAFT_806855 [Mycena belliae]
MSSSSTTNADLIAWTKTQFTDMYDPSHASRPLPPSDPSPAKQAAASEAQLNAVLEAAIAPDAEIYLNHARVDRAAFGAWAAARRGFNTEVQCAEDGLLARPVEEGDDAKGTIVAGTLTLVRTHAFRIRAAPARTRTVLVFSARIVREGEGAQPRIAQLFQTAVDRPFRIVMPTVRHEPGDATSEL